MDDDDYVEIDPEYGVFGSPGGFVPRPPPEIYVPSPRQQAAMERQRQKREAEAKTSRDFNSHMIALYNQSRRG